MLPFNGWAPKKNSNVQNKEKWSVLKTDHVSIMHHCRANEDMCELLWCSPVMTCAWLLCKPSRDKNILELREHDYIYFDEY